ncbi:MAG: sodium:solute symporter family protein [Desulfitobacteriaceae bacterium]
MAALILIVYIVAIFIFAIRGRSLRNIEDFVLARGKLGPYALGISFASAYASASLFMGVSGWSYSWGESVLFYPASIFGFSILGLLFFAKRFRKIGVEQNSVSLADWIGNRYGSNFLRTGVAALTLFNVTYIAGQFIGVAYLLQSFFSVPYAWGVIISALVVMIYVSVGGTYSNVRTDLIQGIVMAVLALTVFVGGYLSFPHGFVSVQQGLINQGGHFTQLINPDSSVFNSVWALISIGWLLFIFVANPHLISLVLSLKDPKEFRKFFLTATICLFTYQLMPFAGLFARADGLVVTKADMVLPEFLKLVFPSSFVIIVIIAVVSAAFTTVNALFVAVSAVISNDLYRKGSNRILGKTVKGNNKDYTLLVGRISVWVVGAVAVSIALSQPKSLTSLVWIGINGVLSGVAGPIMAGILLPQAHRVAAISSFLVGVVSYLIIYLFFISNVMEAGALSSFSGMAVMFLVNWIVSLGKNTSAYTEVNDTN